jgi:hypothetical protein
MKMPMAAGAHVLKALQLHLCWIYISAAACRKACIINASVAIMWMFGQLLTADPSPCANLAYDGRATFGIRVIKPCCDWALLCVRPPLMGLLWRAKGLVSEDAMLRALGGRPPQGDLLGEQPRLHCLSSYGDTRGECIMTLVAFRIKQECCQGACAADICTPAALDRAVAQCTKLRPLAFGLTAGR